MTESEVALICNDSQCRTISLTLDPLDARDLMAAIAKRNTWVLPDGRSDHIGATLAEICRGWAQFIARSERENP